ncbi:NAD(P)/FAD-dependent oxidoreductase [Antrihabitans sp. YC2-6]|uniref:flavin-containing monooxygenase n=1 Tax=Antrihabitans sp. YC2-6 TaxID=2799498 RepID=UPI0018F619BE|nr:NAD(P)/FAD-dependent oxidoreductase [Antrihabitans sp. YC2-6]MBJ8345740.1 NAD(P)/FAD-dependent oxidoreductase [Antrihabitans sp. YC2-6]
MTSTSSTPDFEIVIIGAGFGGLGIAMALRRAGMSGFVIFERADDIGGTWRANHYPDVATDVPGISYQFSYEKNPNWSRVFPKGAEVKQYVEYCAEKYDLRRQIRLNTEVMARTWDEENRYWKLDLADGTTTTARFVIAALGAFVEPKLPAIRGLNTFSRKVIQTQAWDHDYDLTGKRVGVIGTGATSVQMIPQVAKAAGHLSVFQRRAIWVFPKPDLTIAPAVQSALRRVPGLLSLTYRAVSAVFGIGIYGVTVKGAQLPFLSTVPMTVGRAYLRSQVPDAQLREKLTPDYGFGCKRPSVSNIYYKTFTEPHVELVTERIEEITQTGIVTADGREHELDVLVLATGFETSTTPDVYRKRPVTGRDGFDLAEFYQDSPLQAYEGVSLPQLPNAFSIFGPYSWSGGSWHEMVETQSVHIVRVLKEAARRGANLVAVRPEANERFFQFIRGRSRNTLIGSPTCATSNTYYLDHHGDFSLLRPTTPAQARRAAETFSLDDYEYC